MSCVVVVVEIRIRLLGLSVLMVFEVCTLYLIKKAELYFFRSKNVKWSVNENYIITVDTSLSLIHQKGAYILLSPSRYTAIKIV